jgi:hypothetical protein
MMERDGGCQTARVPQQQELAQNSLQTEARRSLYGFALGVDEKVASESAVPPLITIGRVFL